MTVIHDATDQPVGTVTKPAVSDATQSKKLRSIDLIGVRGRHVDIHLTPASNDWTFVDESGVRQ